MSHDNINPLRRRLLAAGVAGPGLWFATRFAGAAEKAGKTPSRVLSVFLRGACDADSVIFQADNAFYYDARPNIAIGRSGIQGVLYELGGGWALHPAMAPLIPLLDAGQCAFMPFFGSGDNSRSHFQAQDVMERVLLSGDPATAIRAGEGFANRILQNLQVGGAGRNLGGFYTGSQNPIAARGSANMAFVDVRNRNAGNSARDQRQLAALRMMYVDPETSDRVMLASEFKAEVAQTLELQRTMMEEHGATARDRSDLVSHFGSLADLMRRGGKFSVAFTDIGGWDTHVQQGNETGLLAGKLQALSSALAGFAERMGPAWQETRVLVISEFGRTFRENGNRGTDHGHGTTVWLAGGAAFDGKVIGRTIRYAADTLHEGRDMPILNTQKDLSAVSGLPIS